MHSEELKVVKNRGFSPLLFQLGTWLFGTGPLVTQHLTKKYAFVSFDFRVTYILCRWTAEFHNHLDGSISSHCDRDHIQQPETMPSRSS